VPGLLVGRGASPVQAPLALRRPARAWRTAPTPLAYGSFVPSYRTGVVTEVLSERAGLQRVLVDGERAYVLTQLIGPVEAGDRVVVNTTAVDLGLGTGGWHVVHWNLARDGWAGQGGGDGHVMKLRYTSLQADSGAAEERHPDLPDSLPGTPVVAIAVHSQLAAVAAAFAQRRPRATGWCT